MKAKTLNKNHQWEWTGTLVRAYRRQHGLCLTCGKPVYIKRDGNPAIVCLGCLNKKDERKKAKKAWRIRNLKTHGRTITKLNKRPYTANCEICGAKPNRLAYHHWDDTNYNKGLWLCRLCHTIAEITDIFDGKDNSIRLKYIVSEYQSRRETLDELLNKNEPA